MARAKAPKGSQITLFQQPEAAEPFKKAVQAIHVSPVGGSLTLQQRRLFNALIKNAIEHRLGEAGTVETFQISIPEMMANLALTTKDTTYIKETAKSLMRTVVDWDQLNSDGTATWTGSTLLAGARISGSLLSYSFAPQIREELLNPERYAMIDMRIAKLFRRAHSLALWENTVRYERAGITARIPLTVFRNLILGREESETKYKEYKIFKRAVLNPCIAEICDVSDHDLELIEHKVGRSVTELQFRIMRKNAASDDVAGNDAAGNGEADIDDLIQAIVGLGLPASEARRLIEAQPPVILTEAIAHVRARVSASNAPAIDNVSAHFRKTLADMVARGTNSGTNSGTDGGTASTGKGRGAAEIGEAAVAPPPPAKSAQEAMERYIAARLPSAQGYFVGLAAEEQMPLIEQYNEQCASADQKLVTHKRPTKVAQTRFYQWLADQTWGVPTADDVLSFVLTGQVAA
ncbi:replication initiation protein [Cupriavidus pauculus]|uniref:RepB family plasmid replication initiator protein n=1 Tax=Cupriavidus pauculus TaxID=82633 RepID=A0A2N5C6U5_9BURK|nr:replication initiation protein [Cupriavidus pauculus]PLP97933.1 RepB family plasmid replication initiator protein [Cupriavidus pauculus]